MKPASSPHPWRFFRAGGFDQVRLDTGADLPALDCLDPKLWVALACPAQGLEFDPRTLAFINTDHDGRIRARDLIQAVQWAGHLLKNPDDLLKHTDLLPLEAINDASAEGQDLVASARFVLAGLGKPDATAVSLTDLADAAGVLAQTAFNGDGIVGMESAEDDTTRSLLIDIQACVGPVTDAAGRPGVNQTKVEQFFAECAAWDAWLKQAEAGETSIFPLGENTARAAAALQAVRTKVEDYFGRCRLAAFDSRAQIALNREEKEYLALAAKDLSFTAAEVAGFPLAGRGARQASAASDRGQPRLGRRHCRL